MTNYEELKSRSLEDMAHALVRMENNEGHCYGFGFSPYKYLTYEAALKACIEWLKEERR